jgi:hypothetical protein
MTIFDDATAVTRRDEGRYLAQADPRFALVAVPNGGAPAAVNGGVLMATVLRAVLDAAPNPYPVATSANFLRVPQIGPAEVEVTWLKTGKTASIARAALVQEGVPVVDMTVTTGTLPDGRAAAANGTADQGETLSWTGDRPLFPDLADCVDLGKWPGTDGQNGVAGFAAHVEVLLDPAVTGWRRHEPSGRPEMRGYVRLREHRDPDALMLALAVDALPPVVFGLGATGWAPTVELTWHMRAVPAAGPLRVAARSRHVSGGWFDEEAEVWDAAGQLVAQSRQLARVGRGRLRPAGQLQAAAGATGRS